MFKPEQAPITDLCDRAGLDVSTFLAQTKIRVVDAALNFRNFGGKKSFSGKISTIRAFESNPMVCLLVPRKYFGTLFCLNRLTAYAISARCYLGLC